MSHYIAMWSGPRNISTAMMRAWGARSDTFVCDEPFYAHYLQQTGYTHHPGYQEILATHETDWRKVVQWLTGPLPEGKDVFFQKQMAQHLLPHLLLDWTDALTNVLLIRDPRAMLLSLLKFFPQPTAEETGLPRQAELFDRVRQKSGRDPIVIDSKDVLQNPRGMLEQLCDKVGVPFDEGMLQWRPGIHATDGAWAKHWYANVAESTTFEPYRPREGAIPAEHAGLLQRCQQLYDKLAAHKLQPPTTTE